jgi:hypothetical protein
MTTATSNSEKQEVTKAVGAKRQQTTTEYSYNGTKLQWISIDTSAHNFPLFL